MLAIGQAYTGKDGRVLRVANVADERVFWHALARAKGQRMSGSMQLAAWKRWCVSEWSEPEKAPWDVAPPRPPERVRSWHCPRCSARVGEGAPLCGTCEQKAPLVVKPMRELPRATLCDCHGCVKYAMERYGLGRTEAYAVPVHRCIHHGHCELAYGLVCDACERGEPAYRGYLPLGTAQHQVVWCVLCALPRLRSDECGCTRESESK